MGRPKLSLSIEDKLERRKKQNRESQARYRSVASKEKLTTDRWSRRQRHPESVKKDLERRKAIRVQTKAILHVEMVINAKKGMKHQAREPGMQRMIKRLIRA
jgi:hypothetical protein